MQLVNVTDNAKLSVLEVIAAPFTPLESWRQTYFGTPVGTGNAADYFDFDRDGLVNLLEYATNNSPNAPNPNAAVLGQNAGRLTLTFTRLAPATVTYLVEATNNLNGGWTTIATLPPGAADWTLASGAARSESGSGSTRTTTITDTQLLTGPSPCFLRLRVIPPAP